MITTTGSREIDAYNVYRDDSDGMHFYVMPKAPVIALDAQKKPIFSLVMYRRDLDKLTLDERRTKLGGGILTFSVELSFPADDEAKIRAELAKDPTVQYAYELQKAGVSTTLPFYKYPPPSGTADPAEVAKALDIGLVPIKDGTVGVAVLGEDKPGEFTTGIVGSGKVAMSGLERASFMVKLTTDGAVLLWKMLEDNLSSIRVQYDLTYQYRVLGLELVAWADARKAFGALQRQYQTATEDASFQDTWDGSGNSWHSYDHSAQRSALDVVGTIATAGQFSGVTLQQEAPDDVVKPELKQQLIQQGNDMIKEFLASSFLDYKPGSNFQPAPDPSDPSTQDVKTDLPSYDGKKYGGDSAASYKLKSESDVVFANFSYDMKMQTIQTGTFSPNDNLSNILQGRDVKQFRVEVDLRDIEFRYLDVRVVCTQDFDTDPVSLVKAHLEYKGKASDGPTIADLTFQKDDNAPKSFAAYLAGPDALSYSYQYEIHYKDSPDVYTTHGTTKATVLVLDTDAVGVLKVDVQAGLVNWDDIGKILVRMSYGAVADEFTLEPGRQSHKWVAVIGQPVTSPYTYKLTYVMKADDQRIELDPQTETSRTLVVDEPLDQRHTFLFLAAGSFGDVIKQIAVAVRYEDATNDYRVEDAFVLNKEGDSHTWKLRLPDKTKTSFSYQVKVFYADNTEREDDWVTTSDPITIVGDAFDAKVTFYPNLLKKDAVWSFATLDVKYDDTAAKPAPIHVQRTFMIDDFSKPTVWRFRLGAVDRRKFTYQLTGYRASDNKSFTSGPIDETREIVPLEPPPVQ